MRTFANFKNDIAEKLARADASSKTQIGKYVNDSYKHLWDSYVWRESIVFDRSVTTVAASAYLIVPGDIDDVFIITDRANSVLLNSNSNRVFQQKYIANITSRGSAYGFTRAGVSATSVELTSASAITFTSTDAQDYCTVLIVGLNSNGARIEETVSINGVSSWTTTNSFSSIISISKSNAVYGVMRVAASGSTLLDYIAAPDTANRYLRLRLGYINSAATELYITGKRKFVPLSSDHDVPLIPVSNVLFSMGCAEAYRAWGSPDQAQFEDNKAIAQLASIVGSQENTDNVQQIFPKLLRNEEDQPL